MNDLRNFNSKSILTLIISIFIGQSIWACDLCGCSTSSGSSGFGTLDNLSFVGVRYIYQTFESKDGIFSNSPTSDEHFNTYQVWGRVPITKSFYVNAIVPYQDLTRRFNDRTEHIKGMGDISVIGWYQLKFYKKRDENKIDFNVEKEESPHRLNFGLGIKLPTGEFQERLTDRINPGFQVGTGSTDAIFSVIHSYSKNKFGLNTSATYYLKTENKNEYRFGNQFSFASNAYYSVPFKESALRPFVGISGNIYNSIEQFNEVLNDTDGTIINGTIGSEFMFDKFVVGANYTVTISQNLFGNNVLSQNRFTVYLNYIL